MSRLALKGYKKKTKKGLNMEEEEEVEKPVDLNREKEA
jgi:hypothetical protein